MSDAGRPALTPTRWAILALVARGASNAEIAATLGLTHAAVRNQLLEIYRRLPLGAGGNQRVLAVLWYQREGQRWHAEASCAEQGTADV